jgi:hypothetical protein
VGPTASLDSMVKTIKPLPLLGFELRFYGSARDLVTALRAPHQHMLVAHGNAVLRTANCPCGEELGRAHRGGPGSITGQVMWDLRWKKWHWGRFPPGTSVSPANSHSTDCFTLIIIYHPGLVQWADVQSGLSLTQA